MSAPILSVSVDGLGEMQVTLRVSDLNTECYGLMLATVVQNVARLFEEEGDMDPAQVQHEIMVFMNAELAKPARDRVPMSVLQ